MHLRVAPYILNIRYMNDNKFVKIFTVVFFLILASVSCWATAESLHLLLPSYPRLLCWAVTIGFFFIASWGTKMICDSLNQNVYMERRGANLVGGLAIVIVFWLLCSMPTNTHTFFYRSLIHDKVTSDITTTQGYLAQIKDGVVTNEKINARIADLKNRVEAKMGELEAEIMNDANPGNGPKAKAILADFATMLDVAKIEPLSYVGTTQQDRQKLCNAYRNKIFILRDTKIKNIRTEMTPATDSYRKAADRDWENLELIKKDIGGGIDLNDADDIKTVCEKLNEGYSTIKMYSQFVNFKNAEDQKQYTANNPQTKVSRMLSVFDVWSDFLSGQSHGKSFLFWILLSVLVDIAAFIFFDIAFRKRD